MRKNTKHLLSIGACSLFLFAAIASTDNKGKEEEVTKTTAPENKEAAPAIKISADELAKAYEANEVNADNQYKGKVVEVTGTVSNISKDITDEIFVILASEAEFSATDVQCFFSKDHNAEAASLKKGDKITIKGMCDGMIMNVLVKGVL